MKTEKITNEIIKMFIDEKDFMSFIHRDKNGKLPKIKIK